MGPGPGHIQYTAHRGDLEFIAMLVGKAVLHSGPLAKHRATFKGAALFLHATPLRPQAQYSAFSADYFSVLSGVTVLPHLYKP